MNAPDTLARTSDASDSLPHTEEAPLLCIGHSHVKCVVQAAMADGIPVQGVDFWDRPDAIVRKGPRARLASHLTERVDRHPGKVLSLIGGSAYVVVGMLVHPRRLDFVLPEEPQLPLDSEAEILPAAAVKCIVAAQMEEFLALMGQVREHSALGILHCQAPPPSASVTSLYGDIVWSMLSDRRHEISPVWLRYKLWRVESLIVREWCAEHGVTFVPCPTDCQDANGCLAKTYYEDGAHANVAYGRRVLEQIRGRV